jgi:hypothetical protein
MEVDEELEDDVKEGVGAGGGGGNAVVGEEGGAGFKQLQPPWNERSNGMEDGEGVGVDLSEEKKAYAAAEVGGCNGAGGEFSGRDSVCYGCLRVLAGEEVGLDGDGAAAGGADMVLRCPQCKQLFCYECDAFVHETLHNCPGCECGLPAAGEPQAEEEGEV